MGVGAVATIVRVPDDKPRAGSLVDRRSVWLVGFRHEYRGAALQNLKKVFSITDAHAAHLLISMPVELHPGLDPERVHRCASVMQSIGADLAMRPARLDHAEDDRPPSLVPSKVIKDLLER